MRRRAQFDDPLPLISLALVALCRWSPTSSMVWQLYTDQNYERAVRRGPIDSERKALN
jgi:hypothetical protein